jgi:hypothetical protein
MRRFRSYLRQGTLAAILLMVMQVLGTAVAAARQIENAVAHAGGKTIVICSVHGKMLIDWDGPAPPPAKTKGTCPMCLTGCAPAAAAKLPLATLICLEVLMPPEKAGQVLALHNTEAQSVTPPERPSHPRAPPQA